MSAGSPPNPTDLMKLPASPSSTALPATPAVGIIPSNPPVRQLSELPKDELNHLAEEFGLDPNDFRTPQHLVTALHERRQAIAAMDREAMLDVIKWGRRPVTYNASKEQIAQEIVRIRSMKFDGLSQRGLVVLATLRGLSVSLKDPVPAIVKKLKKQEGIFSRLNRKRRAMLGSMVSRMIGDEPADDYQFLPSQQPGGATQPSGSERVATTAPPSPAGTIKDEIEEAGLLGGIAGRIKRSADSYLNQKLDEIEARIDRKLDEIDRRLGEWRDKEIANRIRILKITLWASVIVGAFSLIYSYIQIYFPKNKPTPPPQQTASHVQPQQIPSSRP
jgi:hypothetical protein